MTERPATPAKSAGASGAAAKKKAGKPNVFARIVTFIREVFAELRIAHRPTRAQWWSLVLVVLLFVFVVMLYVGVLDVVFAKIVSWIFG